MTCPFPGMDPYIERPEIWPDFHDRLITYVAEALQPSLRPRYAAVTQERLYVVESERPIRPDVSVVRTDSRLPFPGSVATTAVLETDEPCVFEFWREEIREPMIHIIEPAAGNRVVTAIEVLSPTNKTLGAGHEVYCRKREELWLAGTNLVEIDLLREGELTLRLNGNQRASLRNWRYLVAVTRLFPSRQEVYPIPLQQRLPKVSVPLAYNDPDVVLDLQAAFRRCWESGPYPALLGYQADPPGKMSEEELRWCVSQLTAAGLRTPASS